MKVYVDTSVFGGFFDREFSDPSKVFFDEIKRQRFTLVISAVVQAEIEPSPEKVLLRQILLTTPYMLLWQRPQNVI